LLVNSERINDETTYVLSKDIAKKIETELSYPGQIKVVVVRETRGSRLCKKR
jgi:ribonuclease Y